MTNDDLFFFQISDTVVAGSLPFGITMQAVALKLLYVSIFLRVAYSSKTNSLCCAIEFVSPTPGHATTALCIHCGALRHAVKFTIIFWTTPTTKGLQSLINYIYNQNSEIPIWKKWKTKLIDFHQFHSAKSMNLPSLHHPGAAEDLLGVPNLPQSKGSDQCKMDSIAHCFSYTPEAPMSVITAYWEA